MLPSDRAFLSGLSRRDRVGKQDGIMDWAQGISNVFPALALISCATSLSLRVKGRARGGGSAEPLRETLWDPPVDKLYARAKDYSFL